MEKFDGDCVCILGTFMGFSVGYGWLIHSPVCGKHPCPPSPWNQNGDSLQRFA